MENVTVIGLHTTLCVCDVTTYEILNFNSFNSTKKKPCHVKLLREVKQKWGCFSILKILQDEYLLLSAIRYFSIGIDLITVETTQTALKYYSIQFLRQINKNQFLFSTRGQWFVDMNDQISTSSYMNLAFSACYRMINVQVPQSILNKQIENIML